VLAGDILDLPANKEVKLKTLNFTTSKLWTLGNFSGWSRELEIALFDDNLSSAAIDGLIGKACQDHDQFVHLPTRFWIPGYDPDYQLQPKYDLADKILVGVILQDKHVYAVKIVFQSHSITVYDSFLSYIPENVRLKRILEIVKEIEDCCFTGTSTNLSKWTVTIKKNAAQQEKFKDLTKMKGCGFFALAFVLNIIKDQEELNSSILQTPNDFHSFKYTVLVQLYSSTDKGRKMLAALK